ncbi:ThuA domain-containing protein [Phenylobacterium montanum]|uniref:ThuA domain-containing protein n=1 Tax=Phenylobacterium montanum TaxID=2823693 RepID=A0A975IX49_9CAUL|nr:ThuA domain-containing protein [Caulobacter sp. S6]QUD90525.1 ThuA domain-containing protein [Caulobacter sp. S6]
MSDVKRRVNCVLIAGGKYHDIDFARLEILKLLAEDDRVRVRVFEDYSNLEAIEAADFLVSYTCDVTPSLVQQEALRAWLERGGRWYALHGTNSILRFLSNGLVDSPRWAPHFMQTLGSMFVAHPPIAPYRVTVADPGHPLVEGVEPFDATDELYLSEYYGALHVLLETEFEGEAAGFVESRWEKARHPVFYIHTVGAGAVLYLTLGHCRGHYDMQPLIDFYPEPEKGSWALPVFYDLLRRGLGWVKAPALAEGAAG